MSAIAEFIDTLEDKIEKLLQNEEEFRNNQDLKNN
jgi:hypothetical protein